MLVTSQQWFLFFGAITAALAVAFGAFGAHALKLRLSPEMLNIFEVGVRYQLYHALAMCLASWALGVTTGSWAYFAGYCFLIGTIIFSGSLYILVLTSIRGWGAITPIGGLFLILGWICLAISAFKTN